MPAHQAIEAVVGVARLGPAVRCRRWEWKVTHGSKGSRPNMVRAGREGKSAVVPGAECRIGQSPNDVI
jgi:hypothetical protein